MHCPKSGKTLRLCPRKSKCKSVFRSRSLNMTVVHHLRKTVKTDLCLTRTKPIFIKLSRKCGQRSVFSINKYNLAAVSNNYNFAIGFALTALRMRLSNSVLGSDARFNLLQEQLVEPDRLPLKRIWDRSWLRNAIIQRVAVIVSMVLRVRTREVCIHARFGMSRIFQLLCSTAGRSSTAFVKGTFLTKNKIVPFNSLPVSILTVHEVEADNIWPSKQISSQHNGGTGRC